MLDSLRARLLLWYTLILALIVLVFASTVCYLYWRSLVQGVDRDLGAAAAVIDDALRPVASDFDFDLPPQYRAELASRSPRTYFGVFNGQGDLIDSSDPDVALRPAPMPDPVTRDGRRELTRPAAGGTAVVVASDLGDARRQVIALGRTVSAAGGMVLLLSLAGGWFLTGRALAPVARISRVATAMSRGDLSARIPIEQTENELEQLAATLNDAFDRLRLAADIQRRFTADASHELRTPLATIAAEFDWALARPRSAAEYQETLATCRRASDRMRRIVDELLTLARDEGAGLERRREPVDLLAVVHDAAMQLSPLAEERGVTIDLSGDAAPVVGDPNQLGELVVNLLKNAVDYTDPAGRVTLAVERLGADVLLRVRDTGIGIGAEDLPHVFERFYRADKARSRRTGGTGLGLAIVKRVADEHGASIACTSEPGRGTEMAVRFPAATPAGRPV